jgi:hypothetical protein
MVNIVKLLNTSKWEINKFNYKSDMSKPILYLITGNVNTL